MFVQTVRVIGVPIDDDGNDLPECQPIELGIQVGAASVDQIAELFCAISKLWQLMGGNGIRFSVPDREG